MARPKAARAATAYDIGYEHGRNDTPGGPPDYVATNPDLLEAYDEGLRAGTDSLDTDRPDADRAAGAASQPQRQRHRAAVPRPRRAAAATPTTRARSSAPSGGAGGARFSHPVHWGSGARRQVVRGVRRPTLTPPSRLSIADGTGFAFGLVLYALALSYVRYGPKGPASWLSAKFVNRPLITADQAKNLAGGQ